MSHDFSKPIKFLYFHSRVTTLRYKVLNDRVQDMPLAYFQDNQVRWRPRDDPGAADVGRVGHRDEQHVALTLLRRRLPVRTVRSIFDVLKDIGSNMLKNLYD